MTIMRTYCIADVLKKKMLSNDCMFIPRRYRFKKKWAVNLKETPNCQLALNNFDAFYKPYFGDQWPSIRVSLLSLPKYCAVINNYGNAEKIASRLEDLDISNFVDKARAKENKEITGIHKPGDNIELKPQYVDVNSSSESKTTTVFNGLNSANDDTASLLPPTHDSNKIDLNDEDLYKENLSLFVPTEQVYSEKELLLREEFSINSFQPRDAGIDILHCENISISRNVNAFVCESGDVSMFPQPKPYNSILGYYLMDAASVMPVIALDIQPDDQVLDLCAAPGGKSYIILQSLDLHAGGTLCCNDASQSRLTRLRNVMHSHFPTDIAAKVNIIKMDGTESFAPKYNKVLVDAPCNADRHVVTENDNNLFKMSRTRERLSLMETQKELLITGIKACIPGGTIVYSTCTLSPAQNDGVIQAAIEELMETSEIKVAIQDLSPLAKLFGHVFKFHEGSRYGQLICPTLLNNFGPSFFAKLKRIK